MTRDKFVNGYMERSELPMEYRILDGFQLPGLGRQIAVPCDCGEKDCKGWSMKEAHLECKHFIFSYMGGGYWVEGGGYEQRHRCIDCGHEERDVPDGSVMLGHAPGECEVCDRNAEQLPPEQAERWRTETAR